MTTVVYMSTAFRRFPSSFVIMLRVLVSPPILTWIDLLSGETIRAHGDRLDAMGPRVLAFRSSVPVVRRTGPGLYWAMDRLSLVGLAELIGSAAIGVPVAWQRIHWLW